MTTRPLVNRTSRYRRTLVLLGASLVALWAGALAADEVERPMKAWEDDVWNGEGIPADHWISGLAFLERMVLEGEGESEAATFEARDLVHQMVQFDASGNGHAELLAHALTLKAVVEHRSGQTDEAIWTWYAAQNLGTSDLPDLAKFGASGTFLAEHMLRDVSLDGVLTDVYDPGGVLTGLVPPQRLASHYPPRPRAFQTDQFSEVVFIQSIIDEDGTLRRPVVVDTGGYPTLIYSAFDALRKWKFAPARLDGEPVPMLHVVAITFSDDRPQEYTPAWEKMGAGGEAVARRP